MEKSKPSEEEVLKLGKQIIEELQLSRRGNTLERWMSHYLAELILQVGTCENEDAKKLMKKECCEVILKIWALRGYKHKGIPKRGIPGTPMPELKQIGAEENLLEGEE